MSQHTDDNSSQGSNAECTTNPATSNTGPDTNPMGIFNEGLEGLALNLEKCKAVAEDFIRSNTEAGSLTLDKLEGYFDRLEIGEGVKPKYLNDRLKNFGYKNFQTKCKSAPCHSLELLLRCMAASSTKNPWRSVKGQEVGSDPRSPDEIKERIRPKKIDPLTPDEIKERIRPKEIEQVSLAGLEPEEAHLLDIDQDMHDIDQALSKMSFHSKLVDGEPDEGLVKCVTYCMVKVKSRLESDSEASDRSLTLRMILDACLEHIEALIVKSLRESTAESKKVAGDKKKGKRKRKDSSESEGDVDSKPKKARASSSSKKVAAKGDKALEALFNRLSNTFEEKLGEAMETIISEIKDQGKKVLEIDEDLRELRKEFRAAKSTHTKTSSASKQQEHPKRRKKHKADGEEKHGDGE